MFITAHSNELLITCSMLPEQRGINMDHLPILMELKLEVATAEAKVVENFHNVIWEDFRDELRKQLSKVKEPTCITTQVQLDECCEELTKALQEAIRAAVLTDEIMPKSKRWWMKELSQLRAHANKLGRTVYNLRDNLDHQVHKEHKVAKNKYQNAIKTTKQQH